MSTQDIAQGIANVAMDPCLGTVAQQLNKLHELEASSSIPGVPSAPTQAALGIGLCKAVGPLQFVIWARTNPIPALMVGALVIGTIFGVGFKVGKRKGKGSTAVAGLKESWTEHQPKTSKDVWSANWGRGRQDSKSGRYKAPSGAEASKAYAAGWDYGKRRGVAGMR
jgi:hypothetical protein